MNAAGGLLDGIQHVVCVSRGKQSLDSRCRKVSTVKLSLRGSMSMDFVANTRRRV